MRERVGPDFTPSRGDLRQPEVFTGPGSAWLVLYEDGVPVACAGLRPLAPGTGGDQAHVRDRPGAPDAATHGGCSPSSRRSPAAGGHQRIRLLTTEVLAEARALYASAGYAVVAHCHEDGQTDYWLEKRL